MRAAADIEERLAAWVAAGLIEPTQAQAIAAHEAARATDMAATAGPVELRDRMAGAIGSLGALLIGLGVLLSVAANWETVGDATKLAAVVTTLVVAYGVGLAAELRGAPRWIGTAGYLVGTLVFAGGVFLLGQTFNVRAHDPLGFLVVAIAASAVAIATSRRPVAWVAAAAWLAWSGHELVESLERAKDEAAALALFGAGALFALAALGLGWLLEGIASRATVSRERPGLADLGVLAPPFRGVALAALLALLVPASFAWHAGDELLEPASATAQLTIAVAVALAAAVLVALYGAPRARTHVAAGLAACALLVLLAVSVQDLVVIAVLANLVLAAGGLGLAALGLAEERRDAYAWGVGWIVALIAARYADVMTTTELGGLGFIGAGLLLLGCAWLVGRSRRLWRDRAAA